MTKFSWEVPLAHLKDFEPYQDFTFALSYLLEISPKYEKYVRQRVDAGDLVYIDNSYNETMVPATPEKMADIYEKYHPTAVASPDADHWDSQTMFQAFFHLKRLIGSKYILGIFRTDLERQFFQEFGGGPTAVSYWWVHQLKQEGLDKVHSLGLRNVPMAQSYRPPTLDTTQMVKLALRGIRLEDWDGMRGSHNTRKDPSKDGTRLERAQAYFNLQLTDEQLELAVHNMVALKEYFNGSSGQVQPDVGEVGHSGSTTPPTNAESMVIQYSEP